MGHAQFLLPSNATFPNIHLPTRTSLSRLEGSVPHNLVLSRRGAITATTEVAVGYTTRGIQGRSSVDSLDQCGVDTESNPAQETVLNSVAEQNVLNEGVAGGSLLGQDTVLGVGGEILGVPNIGGSGLNLGDQVLIEEDLANVRSRSVQEGTVGSGSSVKVNQCVDVGGATGVCEIWN